MTTIERDLEALRGFYGPLSMPPDDPFAYYVWEVLGVGTSAARREMALAALKRIPALTPESLARAAPAKIEQAVALAGANREDRLRAIRAGVDLFRRRPAIGRQLRGPLPGAVEAARELPRIADVPVERLLLLGGGHSVFPNDTGAGRVIRRLQYGGLESGDAGALMVQALGGRAASLRLALIYLEHHAAATCTAETPHCRVCPLTACPEGRRSH